MRKTKHWLMTIAVLLCSLAVNAYNFEVGGIYYNIIEPYSSLTVEVTHESYAYNTYRNNIVIPATVNYNDKLYKVKKIGEGAFKDCISLTSVTIPESVISIGRYAFYDCSNLTSITIPASVTTIGEDAFSGCKFNAVYINNISAWCNINFSNTYSNPLSRATYLYLNGELVTEPAIPEGVKRIGNYAFYGYSNLVAINIPEGLTSIGNSAFYGCSNLNSINFPESVTSIENSAFFNCRSLTSVIIPGSVTSIGGNAFKGCSNLVSATICDGVKTIGYGVFSGCSSLTSISLPESVAGIYSSTFYNCSSLTSITIPKSVTSIGESAFDGCRGLTSVTISENVKSIADYAFSNCSSLTTIIIPESVTEIGEKAFSSCSNLSDVYCYAETVPSADFNTFYNSYPENVTLHVPTKAKESYKSTEPWSGFGTIVTIIPKNLTLTINQYGSGTYCSEYALDFSEVEGLKAYAATGYNSETGVITLTRVMTAKAGVGLFLVGEAGTYTVPTMENTSDNSLNMLVGTLSETTLNSTSSDGKYRNYRYTTKTDEPAPLFYEIEDGYTFKANRAYLQIPTAWLPAEARAISLRFDEGKGTTDMDEWTIDNGQLIIYDLTGRKVSEPQKGNLYIVNGKKIIY